MPNCGSTSTGDEDESRVRRFLDNTSLHGFTDILKSQNRLLTILWGFLALIGISSSIVNISMLFRSFSNADVRVSLTTVAIDQPELPYVTICYGGGWNKTKMLRDEIDSRLVHMADRYSFKMKHSDLNLLVKEAMRNRSIPTIKHFIQYYAYPCKSMIHSYNPCKSCNVSFCDNAIFTFHWTYFSCYSGFLGTQTFPGVLAGAVVIFTDPAAQMKSQQPKSAPHFGLQLSASILPRNPDVLYVPMGQRLAIGVSMKQYTRISQASLVNRTIRCVEASNITQSCELDCTDNYVTRKEGCESITRAPSKVQTTIGLPFCPIFPNKVSGMDNLLIDCWTSCLPDCEETSFQTTLSSYPMVQDDDGKTSTMATIGYSQWKFERICESDGYPISELISNIGGQLGIWLGGSFLALIQVITLCACGYGRKKSKHVTDEKIRDIA